jgi:hypothetical protein
MSFDKTAKNNILSTNKPKLFSSAYTRRIIEGESSTTANSSENFAEYALDATSSFRYDPPGMGLKSTQQINIDWSKFENHTFFNSAEAKVNIAFDKIINEFPFDGTRQEYEEYIDSLTGFEKWVLDEFPKSKSFITFPSGNAASISITDFAGTTFSSLAKNKSGDKIIDPDTKSLTLEMQLYIDPIINYRQVVCQSVSGSAGNYYGYTVGVDASASASTANVFFVVTSGSNVISSSLAIGKGAFNNLAFTLDRRASEHKTKIFKNSILLSTSSNSIELGTFNFINQPLIIGSGTTHQFNDVAWVPTQSFHGAIDEFRLFHNVRSSEELKRYALKNIFPSNDLKLYFKFNEPTGSLGNLTNVVIDSSGNSLHSLITNFTGSMRSTSSIGTTPMTQENEIYNPVLFPAHAEVISLNEDLLSSGTIFDSKNPNLITKLVPAHYLQEGQAAEGFNEEDGTIGDVYGGTSIPGSGEIGKTHLLMSLLFVWAKFFDELKLMIDQFSDVLSVDYENDRVTPDQFLPFIFKQYGFDVPNFFSNSSLNQYTNAEDVNGDYGYASLSLMSVQNQVWRRILANINDIIKSKGTIHSVKSFLRAVGINPDSTVRIREYGGPTSSNLVETRESKTEVSTLIDMSGTLANVSNAVNSLGIPTSKPFLLSTFFSTPRTEVGTPRQKGIFTQKETYPIHGVSSVDADGFWTSGSFTFEAIYKFNHLTTGAHYATQSLARFATSGSEHSVWGNILAMSGASDSKIVFYAKPNRDPTSDILQMVLTGVNIFDGKQWNISIGRDRNDLIESQISSSWFLRAGTQNNGEIYKVFSSSSFFDENTPIAARNILQVYNGSISYVGTMLTIGSQSIPSLTYMLNNTTTVTESNARYTNFSGKIGHIRFWSKGLTLPEWTSHILNFKSLGVLDPKKNFNFVTQESGSFERLRLDVTTDQPITTSNSLGGITLIDFTQGHSTPFDYSAQVLNKIVGTGFEANKQVIKPEIFYYSMISPKFDEASTNNKVRIRGFQHQENIDQFNTNTSPVYEINKSEMPSDDTRFTIDFSIVDALNEDMIRIFSTLDALDNILGDPALTFSDDYPQLEVLRNVYFNRLTGKMNLQAFFELFKWFDTSIGTFIEQLIPRKTNFLGTNFVIESHMLERPKVRHYGEDMYLEYDLRRRSNTTIVVDNT